jgi:SAM-dependent methyltransferase
MGPRLDAWTLTTLTREIYADVPMTLRQRLTTTYRPLYGALDRVLEWIPAGARQLDVGCGSGALLLLAERLYGLESGWGYDPQPASIRLARAANRARHLRFAEGAEAPAEVVAAATVITVVDVLHHAGTPRVLDPLLRHAARGARVIVRDLDPRPRWRAWANRITDYASTRSRVRYVAMQDTAAALTAAGCTVTHASKWRHYVWSPYVVVGTKG